ncbi:MAG: T9SS type A sorting domain-containing protein [Flavobacteriaceae bacterium]|nr:T9SS type A sorting domain-containing protein [Flavobacteriaceae bacterium]
MKTFIICCAAFIFTMGTNLNAQNEINLDELLTRLKQSYMGSITDVFTSEELAVLDTHFESVNSDNTNFDNRGPIIRYYGPENVGGNFGFIDKMDPAVFNPIGPIGTADFDGAGAIFPGSTMAHVIDNAGNFYEVDIITGQYIPMGIILPPTGENFTGMEFNHSTGELMAISTDGTTNQSTLSMIDPVNMTASPIGNTGLMLPIALACDENSQIITVDIDDDMVYRIDTNTATATVVGSIGFDANFGAGMAYSTDALKAYISAYNTAIGTSELREINTETGLSLLIGTIDVGNTSQMAWGGAVNSTTLNTIDENYFDFSFSPNPSNDQIELNANSAIEKVAIYNMLGQNLLTQAINETSGLIDVSALQSGSYVLNVTINGIDESYHILKN